MSNAKVLADLAISDNGFVFDPLAGATYSVNCTGLCVLQSLKGGLGRKAIAHRLVESFVQPGSDLLRDVDDFIHVLRQYGLLAADFSLEA
jgi:hypothetical protein